MAATRRNYRAESRVCLQICCLSASGTGGASGGRPRRGCVTVTNRREMGPPAGRPDLGAGPRAGQALAGSCVGIRGQTSGRIRTQERPVRHTAARQQGARLGHSLKLPLNFISSGRRVASGSAKLRLRTIRPDVGAGRAGKRAHRPPASWCGGFAAAADCLRRSDANPPRRANAAARGPRQTARPLANHCFFAPFKWA